jgi:molybdate transport system regulatory protein
MSRERKVTGAAKEIVPRVRIRILSESVIAIGPGKADLLEAIEATGSISGAARQMRMSYRRAWILVDTMNSCFKTPLIATAKGGAEGGGATLTARGRDVLARFRALSRSVQKNFGAHLKSAPGKKRV